MRMNKYIRSIGLGLLSVAFLCGEAATNLPKVSISGRDYYVYEVKGGDSLYGIANRYGWNVGKLTELNPAYSVKLKKGARIYYPASDEASSETPRSAYEKPETYPTVQHVVRRGETVYGLAKMYGVTIDDIYQANPGSKLGIRRDQVIVIPQKAKDINDGDSFFFYQIKPGDTLKGIADAYNTSVAQLLGDNKGLSDSNFEVGAVIRVAVDANAGNVATETVEKTELDHIDTFTADKDDTWETLAEKTGVDAEKLMEANQGTKLKKNVEISVPVIETTSIEVETEVSDARENTSDGRREIYNEVHGLASAEDAGEQVRARIALLIEDPMSKRDNEFTRGAFLALDELASDRRISLKVVQDNVPSDSLVKSFDDFGAEVVIATYEKNFPEWLSKYGEKNGVEIVNAFDVKNEYYLENPSMIHLLTPSAYFYDEVAEWLGRNLGDNILVMVGKEDSADGIAECLIAKRGSENVLKVVPEQIEEMPLKSGESYLFYGYASGKDDVVKMLDAIEMLKDNNPGADVKVMGRPNWITMADALGEKFTRCDVYFPSRFYFDHTGDSGKEFITKYTAQYGHGPIRSYPTYAVAGYDILNYFASGLTVNDGDFNLSIPDRQEIQTPISLRRVGNWGGFFNPAVYMIRYAPYGSVEKYVIRN